MPAWLIAGALVVVLAGVVLYALGGGEPDDVPALPKPPAPVVNPPVVDPPAEPDPNAEPAT